MAAPCRQCGNALPASVVSTREGDFSLTLTFATNYRWEYEGFLARFLFFDPVRLDTVAASSARSCQGTLSFALTLLSSSGAVELN